MNSIKNKISNILLNNPFIKNSLIFTLFATLTNGLNFLLIFYLSNILSKKEFGELNLFTTLVLIFTTLIPLGSQGYISVIYFKKNKIYINKIINSILSISLVSFLFFSATFFLLPKNLKFLIGIPFEFIIAALFICFFQILFNILLEIFRLQEKPINFGVLTTVFILLNVILTVILCDVIEFGWIGRAYAQSLACLICFIISFFFLRKLGYNLKIEFHKNSIRKILNFGVPLIPHSSTTWLRMGLDRYIINYYLGAAILGSYSFTYNLSGLILMVGTAFNASNSVFIFKSLKENSSYIRIKLKRQISLMALVFLILTIIAMVMMYIIIKFFAIKYNDAIPYIFPLSIAAFFQCIYYLFVNYIFYFQKTKQLMYITFSVSIIHLVLSIMLTKYSALSLAYLNMCTNIFICTLTILYSNRLYPLLSTKKIHE